MSYFDRIKLIGLLGQVARITTTGRLQVAALHRLSGGVLNGTSLDPNYGTTITANGGTVTVANGEMGANVTTASGSASSLYANTVARYMGGNQNSYRSITRVTNLSATNNVAEWGPVDILPVQNGFRFRKTPTTFSIVSYVSGVATVVNSGSFNGDGTKTGGTYTLDLNYHTYEILYTNKTVQFVIDSVAIHTLTATTGPLSGSLHLRPSISNINTGVGSAQSVYTLSLTINREGEATSQPKNKFIQGLTAADVCKYGIGSLHKLIFSGVTNNTVVTLYDNTAATGTVLWTSGTIYVTNQSNNFPFVIDFDGTGGKQFTTGLTISITGAACNVDVGYE